jgi:hypothetical protein
MKESIENCYYEKCNVVLMKEEKKNNKFILSNFFFNFR